MGKDTYDDRYASGGDTKANRLRSFWRLESNFVVGKLIADLIEYWRHTDLLTESAGAEECSRIAERLRRGATVPDMDALAPNSDGRDFDVLANAVREAIENDVPEAGLDRLHTFVVKYVRVLCERRGLKLNREKPLHSLFGEYVRRLGEDGLIESEMTERILKSSISYMEALSRVRNERSLAHDNPTLSREESLYIFSIVAGTIRFLKAIEKAGEAASDDVTAATPTDKTPF